MTPEQGSYTITYGSRRDKGLVREENQDQLISFDSSVFGQVFLLADGMGGHEGGLVAANMAITGFKQHFQTLAAKLSLQECLTESARLTNLDIYEKSNENGGGALRMGSTLVACVVSAGSYVVGHAGDSRCYSFRNGVLTRLTRDHTAVQKMVDAGILSMEDAKNHPDASVLTRAFGQRPAIELEILEPQPLAVDETLLICSDGLYGYVEEPPIIDKLRQNNDPQAAADALVELALSAGGHDNISVFVIRAQPSSTKGITAPDPPFEEEAAAVAQSAPKPEPVTRPLPAAPAPAARSAPAPVAETRRRALAFWLMGIAVLILAGPVTAFLRPDLIPVQLREKLIAWGIPVEHVAGVQSIADSRTAPEDPDRNRVSGATRTGVDPNASGGAPASETKTQSPTDAGAGETKPPSAADASASGSPAMAKVVVIFPPDAMTSAAFADQVHGYEAKIRHDGFEVSEVPRKVDGTGVWRSVMTDPAAFAPAYTFVSAVFPDGFDRQAAQICGAVNCTQQGALIHADDRGVFQESFGAGAIAVFVHPAASRAAIQKPGRRGTGAKQGATVVNPRE